MLKSEHLDYLWGAESWQSFAELLLFPPLPEKAESSHALYCSVALGQFGLCASSWKYGWENTCNTVLILQGIPWCCRNHYSIGFNPWVLSWLAWLLTVLKGRLWNDEFQCVRLMRMNGSNSQLCWALLIHFGCRKESTGVYRMPVTFHLKKN